MQMYENFTNFALMRHISEIILLLFVLLLSACGNDEEFVINCEIRGLGSKGVEMYYTTRGVQRASFHPVDGKVSLRGVSAEPTLVEVFTLDNELLFTCVARNGDELKVKMDLDKPGQVEIKGNDASEQYAAFTSANRELLDSRDVAAINRLVAAEVREHPDRISSAMLLVTLFNARGYELEADSLVNILKPAARPSWVVGAYPGMVGEQVSTAARGNIKPISMRYARLNQQDTTLRYWPSSQSYTMLVFVGGHRADSINHTLRNLYKELNKRRFSILELCVMGDSASWSSSLRGDSVRWMQAWVPGGTGNQVIRSIHVPSLPYFIVADSLGAQVYRGRSLSAADDTVRARLARFLKPDSAADGDAGADTEASTPAASAASHAAPPAAPTARPAASPAKPTHGPARPSAPLGKARRLSTDNAKAPMKLEEAPRER